MSNNPQQLNTADDFSEFDFDEGDVLVKDGESENTDAAPPIRRVGGLDDLQKNIHSASSGQVAIQKHENTKTRKQENVGVESSYVNQPATRANSLFVDAPLDLKKIKEISVGAENFRENLVKQANMQKDKMEILGRKGDGLVFDEKDEEEIEKFKNNSLAKSGFNIDLLVRNLLSQLNIVSTLKIDLINRLKNIVDSFLRDIRGAQATEDLLQRFLGGGGLNLPPEHAKQIMDFIKDEYKKIHSAVFIETMKQENNETRDEEIKKLKNLEIEDEVPDEAGAEVKFSNDEIAAVSRKTAREAQVGVFSDEIANSHKRDNFKPQPLGASGKKDLARREKELAVSGNLRILEISAPKSVKKLTAGTVAARAPKAELPKIENQRESTKSDISFQDLGREDVLGIIDEELAQDKNKVQNLEKKKTPWLFRMFRRKPAKSSKFKVQSSKDGKVPSSKFQVPSLEKKEMPRPQSIIRRVVQNKQNFDNRPKMEDVRAVHPHLVGPIEELSEMTILDFRRFGSTAQDSVDKIREKIEISRKESFNKKIAAINGWRKSQPNQLYIELGRQSLSQKMPVEDLIRQYKLENKPVLSKEEFDLISQLNKELRY